MDDLTKIDDLTVAEQDDPTNETILELKAAVDTFNASRVGSDQTRPLGLVGCDPSGHVQAGLYGLSYWRWLFIEHLWVAERYRGTGVGSLLLTRAERVAVTRGCVGVCLNTMTFQAPGFYERHGYREFGRLKDVPPGTPAFGLQRSCSRIHQQGFPVRNAQLVGGFLSTGERKPLNQSARVLFFQERWRLQWW